MTVLLTGAAGFIGSQVSTALLARGDSVVGVDNLNDYYDVSLKEARLARLMEHSAFAFECADVADRAAMEAVLAAHSGVTRVIHLAAQAGVRYSLENPYAYTRANIEGQIVMLELARRLEGLEHFVYASSSSVYGGNEKLPFAVEDRCDTPVSLYAATKKSGELMAHVYSHLFGLPQSGLRFFTVYGPWGRPDMAAFIFTRKILAGEAIPVFNGGDMRRDFTYIDDIVAGVLGCLDRPPSSSDGAFRHRIYNLGNHHSERLTDFIAILEEALGRKAEFDLHPMQPGDVKESFADISAAERDFGFSPKTSIREGLPRFVDWYRNFYDV